MVGQNRHPLKLVVIQGGLTTAHDLHDRHLDLDRIVQVGTPGVEEAPRLRQVVLLGAPTPKVLVTPGEMMGKLLAMHGVMRHLLQLAKFLPTKPTTHGAHLILKL
jgi:hypothetical protein